MKIHGFTIVELVVVILIISLLSAFGVVSVTRTQLVARDKERFDDVTTISTMFEDIYNDGRPDGKIIPQSTTAIGGDAVPLSYPSTSLLSVSDTQSQAILDRLDRRVLTSPRGPSGTSLIAAITNAGTSGLTVGGVSLNTTNDRYVFQPKKADDALCTVAVNADTTRQVIAARMIGLCKSFSIFYYSEADNAIKEVKSQRKNSDAIF